MKTLAATLIGITFGQSELGLARTSADFFTVDVAIATDHRLIDTGPYQSVRHPSYTGALMAFVGLGLCLHNAASLLVVTMPVLWVFSRRMRIEEDALTAGLGESYRDYMLRTRRLIPGIY
jgi:protein-S-isoprenylcysteine O-methyltransferase